MLESMKKNGKGMILMLCSAICACTGQILWKISVQDELNLLIAVIGFGLYGLGALFMIISYKFGKLSVLQPIQSVNYILSLFLGALVFQEAITGKKIIGLVIIIIGVLCIAGGDKE